MTFGKFAEVYRQRHVLAKGLALSSTSDYRLKPLIERFGDGAIAEIKTPGQNAESDGAGRPSAPVRLKPDTTNERGGPDWRCNWRLSTEDSD